MNRFLTTIAALSIALLWGAISVPLYAQTDGADDTDAVATDGTPAADSADTDATPPKTDADEPSDRKVDQADTKKVFTKYDALLASLTIFVLAVFVGFEVITKVPPTLHTPLMSGSNAISGITIVGALLATGYGTNWFVALVGMIALVLATINVVGGFLVTDRMLGMFRQKKDS